MVHKEAILIFKHEFVSKFPDHITVAYLERIRKAKQVSLLVFIE